MPSFLQNFLDCRTLINLQRELIAMKDDKIATQQAQISTLALSTVAHHHLTINALVGVRRALDDEPLHTVTAHLDAAIADWSDMVARLEEHIA